MDLLSFEDALRSVKSGKRHALLGNGFSQACRPEIFYYGALFDRADFKGLSVPAREAFNSLVTTDFEEVMKALKDSSALVHLYFQDPGDAPTRMLEDSENLKNVLVSAVASSHPERPFEISSEAYSFCRSFLSNFESVYTLNYDLLLYWAFMQEELEPKVNFDDGFRRPYSGEEEYVS